MRAQKEKYTIQITHGIARVQDSEPLRACVGPQERPKGEYAPDLLPIALLWSILRNPYRVNGKSLKIDPIWPVEIAQMFR